MIYVYYTRLMEKSKMESFNFFFQQLPQYMQTKISKYRKWEDAQRSLLGKALLRCALDSIGLHSYSLYDLKFTKFEKPYFDNLVDFNISHAGDYIICALSNINKVGIDVEELQTIPLNDFKDNFSDKEWENILKANDIIYSFFSCWTKKEAFLKAIGMGLNIPLKEVEIIDKKIIWNNKRWFLHEIKLDKEYVCHISCDSMAPEMMVKEINFT